MRMTTGGTTITEWGACLVVAMTAMLTSCARGETGEAGPETATVKTFPKRPPRSLVVIVPGTYGNSDTWCMTVPGRENFAGELTRGFARGQIEVFPFVWSSSIRGRKRIDAARMLVGEIERRASAFDRVILIGHSHGGNIAMWAAGECRVKIDTIVCLGTPHVYLRTKDAQGQSLHLPVYCSPKTLANTRRIECYWAKGDAVAELWSNALLTGVGEMDALQLTRQWREKTGSPRLADDRFVLRLLESDNLFASTRLNLASRNQEIGCDLDDPLGVRPHHAIHSPAMGFELGRSLSSRSLDPLPSSLKVR